MGCHRYCLINRSSGIPMPEHLLPAYSNAEQVEATLLLLLSGRRFADVDLLSDVKIASNFSQIATGVTRRHRDLFCSVVGLNHIHIVAALLI